MRRILLLLVPLALLVAACGDDSSATTDGPGNASADHGGHDEDSDVADGARRVAITATSFAFDPPTIEAEEGEAIEIELTADDLEHDFVIDELDAHVRAGAGETVSGGFVADEVGTYAYYCSVAGHRDAGMEGELVVQ